MKKKRNKKQAINGGKLRRVRLLLGKGCNDVATILNNENGWKLSHQTIRNWENGVNPNKKYRKAIREYIKRASKLVPKGAHLPHELSQVKNYTVKTASGEWTPERRKAHSKKMKEAMIKSWAKRKGKGIKPKRVIKTSGKQVTYEDILKDVPVPKLTRRVTKKGLFGKLTVTEYYEYK